MTTPGPLSSAQTPKLARRLFPRKGGFIVSISKYPYCRRIPSYLNSKQITAIIDTREQEPLDLTPLTTIWDTLVTGDYSVVGLEHAVAIERKSLMDLVNCVGRERQRFDRVVQRLLAYPLRALVVETSWEAVERRYWLKQNPRSQVTPDAVMGAVYGWIARGLPVYLTGNRDRTRTFVVAVLLAAARNRWSETRDFLGSMPQFSPENKRRACR